MENLKEIFELCDEIGIKTLGQLKAVKNKYGDILWGLRRIRNRRYDYIADYKMAKILNEMRQDPFFVCEICGTINKREHEGSEPNTCEHCMPKKENCEIRNILDIIE